MHLCGDPPTRNVAAQVTLGGSVVDTTVFRVAPSRRRRASEASEAQAQQCLDMGFVLADGARSSQRQLQGTPALACYATLRYATLCYAVP